MKDTNGVEIEVGDMVAFNRSGFVMKGIVTKFGRGWRRGWDPYNQGDSQGRIGSVAIRAFTKTYIQCCRDQKESCVNRPTSILVIAKREKSTPRGECPLWISIV